MATDPPSTEPEPSCGSRTHRSVGAPPRRQSTHDHQHILIYAAKKKSVGGRIRHSDGPGGFFLLAARLHRRDTPHETAALHHTKRHCTLTSNNS